MLRWKIVKNYYNMHKYFIWLTGLVLLVILILFWQFIIGDKVYIYSGSDAYLSYFPKYVSIVDKIKNGNFTFMSLNYGLGNDLLSGQMIICDPFAIIIYLTGLFFGIEKIATAIIVSQCVKILVAAYSCYFYLKNFSNCKRNIMLIALIYAFNGYIILWGQHYFFATVVALFPILLNIVEKIIKDDNKNFKHIIRLSLLVCVLCIFSVYFTYMMLLFTGIYSLVRIFFLRKINKIIKIMQLLVGVLLGICLSAIIFIPSAYAIISTGNRLSSNTSFIEEFVNNLKPYDFLYYKTLLGRLLSNNAQGIAEMGNTWINKYESPQIFMTILVFFLVPQYICFYFRKENKKNKMIASIVIGLVLFLLLIPAGSWIFAAFTTATCRTTFLLLPIIAVFMVLALDQISKCQQINKKVLSVSFLLLMSDSIYMIYSETVDICALTILITEIILGFLVFIVLYNIRLCPNKRNYHPKYIYVILVVILVNIIIEHYQTINMRMDIAKPKTSMLVEQECFNTDTLDAIGYIKKIDPGLYRIGRNYYDVDTNDSVVQTYRGLSSYCSNDNKYYKFFLQEVFPNVLTNDVGMHVPDYRFTQYASQYLGQSYLLKKGSFENNNLKTIGDISIEETNSIPIIAVYTNVMSEKNFKKLSVVERQEAIFSNAILDDDICEMTHLASDNNDSIIKKEIIEINQLITEKDLEVAKEEHIIKIKTGGLKKYIEIPMQRSKKSTDCIVQYKLKVSSYGEIMTEYKSTSFAYDMTWRKVEGDINYKMTEYVDGNVDSIKLYGTGFEMQISDIEVYEVKDIDQLINEVKENSIIEDLNCITDGNIQANVTAKQDGILQITIPYSDGWDIYIDGEKQETFISTLGFIGTKITKGEHNVNIYYSSPGMKLGKIITIIAIFIYSVLLISYTAKNRNVKDSLLK